MNKAWPCPAGDHSTRQWLTRSGILLPPSCERRTNEFSPVITGSCGSTRRGSAVLIFTSRSALDDADIALHAVGEGAQRFLVCRALVSRDRLVQARKLAHHRALIQSALEGLRRRAAHQKLSAGRLDRRAGELGVRRELLRILDRTIGHHPIGLGHSLSPLSGKKQ